MRHNGTSGGTNGDGTNGAMDGGRVARGWGWAVGGACLLAAGLVGRHVLAVDPPPAVPPTLLGQLSAETERVYGTARRSVVRVQFPYGLWTAQLRHQQQVVRDLSARFNPEPPATGPATTVPVTAPSATKPPTTNPAAARPAIEITGQIQLLTAVGLLVDGDGHVVLPVYFDRDVVGSMPMPAWTGDGRATTATFAGSDALTGLTVLRLADHGGTPVSLDHGRPEDGSLAVVIAFDGSGRLAVWSGFRQETGLVVLPDGSFSGFGFDPQHFFAADQARPIVEQLVAHGEVRRPVLGVKLSEVSADDMARQRTAALGSRAAVRVEAVEAGGAGDLGGLRRGDVILTIGSRPVGDNRTFAAVIAGCDGETALHVLRGGGEQDLTVRLHPTSTPRR